MQKCDNFIAAATRLKEAVTEYKKSPDNTLYQDATIQRFEFTFELAWKALKEYMLDQGLKNELNFPKDVLKAAYTHEIIDNDSTWIAMLKSRNLTSHIYDEATAAAIANQISTSFINELERLQTFLISARQ